jgi:hypothetical protein
MNERRYGFSLLENPKDGTRRYTDARSLEDAREWVAALKLIPIEVEFNGDKWEGSLAELFDARVERWNGTAWEEVKDNDPPRA